MSETTIEFSEMLQRRVRLGEWEDQKISTYRKIIEAINEENWDHAADLADYFTDEANVCFSLYRQWINDLQNFLLEKGVDRDTLNSIDNEVVSKLTLPNGEKWNSHRHWDRYKNEQRDLLANIYRKENEKALETLELMKETWRQTHDRDVDHTYGLMSEIQDRFGSQGIVDMFQKLLLPLFSWRYQKFDIDNIAADVFRPAQ